MFITLYGCLLYRELLPLRVRKCRQLLALCCFFRLPGNHWGPTVFVPYYGLQAAFLGKAASAIRFFTIWVAILTQKCSFCIIRCACSAGVGKGEPLFAGERVGLVPCYRTLPFCLKKCVTCNICGAISVKSFIL